MMPASCRVGRVGGGIQGAALDLVENQGLEATTIGHIAERAGISERTFFRYYSSKEHALMPGQTGLVASLVQYESGSGDAAGIMADVLGACRENFAFEVQGSDFRRISRLLVREPELMRFVARQDRDLVEALGGALLKRGTLAKIQAMLVAEVAMVAWRVAWQSFARDELDGVESNPLDHFDRAVRELDKLFHPAG